MSHLLVQADSRRIPLGDGTVHCVCTSPPFYGLRDYGTAAWEGGNPACDHRAPPRGDRTVASGRRDDRGCPYGAVAEQVTQYRAVCGKCGARRVDRQIGLEQSPAAYVAALVEVFREVWRVLRDDGTAWLNLGDSYNGSGGIGGEGKQHTNGGSVTRPDNRAGWSGLKQKDLCMIPARVAIALCDDGWWLRSMCPWVKRASMPESVTDRPSSALEYIFLLAKRPDYFYDVEAVRQPSQMSPNSGWAKMIINGTMPVTRKTLKGLQSSSAGEGASVRNTPESGRNRRNSDWWFESVGMLLNEVGDPLGFDVNPQPFAGAHFACWPSKLVEPMILASTSAAGCCPACGAPWRRKVEREEIKLQPNGQSNRGNDPSSSVFIAKPQRGSMAVNVKTLGWSQSCSCIDCPQPIEQYGDEEFWPKPRPYKPVPAVVLDPFCGSGTSLVVAEALGRNGVGCDLSRPYLDMAARRISRPHVRITTERLGEPLPLFDGLPAPPPLAAVEAEGEAGAA